MIKFKQYKWDDAPEVLYATMVNLAGVGEKPVKVKLLHKDERWVGENASWWDREGNFDANGVGLQVKFGNLTVFSSEDKNEVELFIAGAMAVVRQLKYFVGVKEST